MSELILHAVIAAKYTNDPSALETEIDMTGADGERRTTIFGYRASDQNGLSPLIGQWLADNPIEIAPYEPEPLTQADYAAAIQAHIDAAAVSKQFNDGVTMASYAASTNLQWAAEAQAFVAWRDAVWAYAYAELEKVLTGQRPQPTIEAFLTELPAIAWP